MYILKKENQKMNTWSGGTTTELMIWPLGASYSDRQFDFRISTACVEDAHSLFTSLPGVNRLIMSLNNPLTLIHNNEEVKLKAFDVFQFDGGLKTESFGCVVDFNIMTSHNYQGSMEKVTYKALEDVDLYRNMGLYILEGTCELGGVSYNQHDFLFATNESIELKVLKDLKAIEIRIEARNES